jgi:signal transduction histidine kinase
MSSVDVSGPANEQPRVATNPWFLCQSESEIGQKLTQLLNDKEQIPEYFGIGIEVAREGLRESAPDLRLWRDFNFFENGTKKRIYFAQTATNILAAASHLDAGIPQLKVNVYLTSPSTLFKRQSQRTFWFGSLVAITSLAAFIGLLSAWRAFNRQQELTEMKTNFVSSVSHELRAPIASVRLMAESLERGKIADPPKQQEYFRFISQECRRLSSLIENVLDFSRIEQGRKQYEFEPTDLLALVRQTVKLMEVYGVERQVSVALKLPDHQPSTFDHQLSLDGRAIQQALINLLDNAIKHSPNGQMVSIALECLADSGPSSHTSRVTRHVNISVQDNGPGIPPEEHEKIFERFYRLGSELRRETQGVGIGLSIVKHIVEAHGGRVLVQSAVGKGSRFTIELPVEQTQTTGN